MLLITACRGKCLLCFLLLCLCMYVATLAQIERGNPCMAFTHVNFGFLSYDSLTP